jgi:hypothetical protein
MSRLIRDFRHQVASLLRTGDEKAYSTQSNNLNADSVKRNEENKVRAPKEGSRPAGHINREQEEREVDNGIRRSLLISSVSKTLHGMGESYFGIIIQILQNDFPFSMETDQPMTFWKPLPKYPWTANDRIEHLVNQGYLITGRSKIDRKWKCTYCYTFNQLSYMRSRLDHCSKCGLKSGFEKCSKRGCRIGVEEGRGFWECCICRSSSDLSQMVCNKCTHDICLPFMPEILRGTNTFISLKAGMRNKSMWLWSDMDFLPEWIV